MDDLEELLKKAIDAGVQRRTFASHYNPESYAHQYVDRLFITTKSPNAFQDICEHLGTELGYGEYEGGFLRVGSYSGRFEISTLAKWLISQTVINGGDPEEPAQVARGFIETNRIRCRLVGVVSGVAVDKRIDITDRVYTLPLGDLPPSSYRDQLFGVPERIQEAVPSPWESGLFAHSHTVSPETSGGFCCEFDMQPLIPFIREWNENPSIDNSDIAPILIDARRQLNLVVEGATLFGDNEPVLTVQWYEAVSAIPSQNSVASAGRYMSEIPPASWDGPKTPIDSIGAELIGKFLQLPDSEQKRLRVPLTRLNQARRRSSEIDKAIEIGIALESLLVGDRDKDATIGFLLGLRGALLRGGNTDSKKRTKKLLRSAYGLRSSAVHGGEFSAKEKKADPGRILAEAISLCAELATKVVEAGKFPLWDALELGDDSWPE